MAGLSPHPPFGSSWILVHMSWIAWVTCPLEIACRHFRPMGQGSRSQQGEHGNGV